MTKHKIFYNLDGHIEIKISGRLNDRDVVEIGKKIVSLSTEIEDSGRTVKILIDSSRIKGWTEQVYRLLMIIIKDINFEKSASYCINQEFYNLLHRVAAGTGIGDRARNFNNRQAAQAWLSED